MELFFRAHWETRLSRSYDTVGGSASTAGLASACESSFSSKASSSNFSASTAAAAVFSASSKALLNSSRSSCGRKTTHGLSSRTSKTSLRCSGRVTLSLKTALSMLMNDVVVVKVVARNQATMSFDPRIVSQESRAIRTMSFEHRTSVKMASRTTVTALARKVATRQSVVGAARSQQAVLRTCVASSSRSYAHAAPKSAAPVVPARRKVGAEPIPKIASKDSYDIVIIGAGNAGLALACALCELITVYIDADEVSKQSIADTSRILLVEGGSLD